MKAPLDLSNCSQEQIHVPQATQPHGVYLNLLADSLRICAVSANCAQLLGHAATKLLGAPLTDAVGEAAAAHLMPVLQATLSPGTTHAVSVQLTTPQGLRSFDATAHRHKGRIDLELEVQAVGSGHAALTAAALNESTRRAITSLRKSHTLQELCAAAAAAVRDMTGFDRVMLYRFNAAWDGLVFAEARDEGVASYLGLQFPASDIPAQARELYTRNCVRLLPDAHYQPVPVLSVDNEAVDLTYASLRSVSPIHLEYLHNMGVTASLGLSLVHDGRLWGLILCAHERGPLSPPWDVRAACALVAEVSSSLIESRERNVDSDYSLHLRSVNSALLHRMTPRGDFVASLSEPNPSVLDVADATGAAVFYNGQLSLLGKTPNQEQVEDLLAWLRETPPALLYATASLSSVYPPAAAFVDVASGLLAVGFSESSRHFVLWFRPEVLQTVNWGGDPNGAVNRATATGRIHPRQSFELWKQTVHATSLPWKEVEQQAAADLVQSVIGMILRQSEELASLNVELARSNLELDAFAYAASHDLKEPLRGIHNYTDLIVRELGDEHLVGQSKARLQTVVKLTERMEDLINSLLHYAHVGRKDLTMSDVDLNEVVARVQEMSRARLATKNSSVKIPRPLPTVRGDEVMLGELFANLITNAVKYNDKSQPWVEVSFTEATDAKPLAISVRDNGIGIRERNFETVFNIFKRLHARDKYGGGTGTGLTIARRIVERHGGSIHVASTFGEGTTFTFTLTQEQARGP